VSRRIVFVTILVVTLAATIAIAAGCGGASKTAKAASPSPSFTPPPAWVMEEAARQAAIGGDAHPAYVGWTLATVAEIAPAQGERAADIPVGSRDKQMYLVEFRGKFTTLSFSHPYGYTPPPVIHWVYVALDPATHEVVGSGWSQKGPPASVAKLLHPFQL
jgi:hypothetical protein